MKPALQRLAQPMLIEPHMLRVMVAIASRGRFDAAALAEAKAAWEARRLAAAGAPEPSPPVEGTGGLLRIAGNVGVVTIEGPLFRHADIFTEISGGCSYQAIWRALEAALAHERVSAILLRVNSPGGEADGVNELAGGIAAAAKKKPIWTYADGMTASAAYWLASQTDRIVAEETAEIGSIGAKVAILDDSEADAMNGVREIEIVSSQSPNKRSRPLDESVVGRMQTRLDDLAQVFVESVARGRGVDEATVLEYFGQGDVMIAAKALEAGLVDEVGTFNETLAALAAHALQPPEQRAAARAPRKEMAMAKTPKLRTEEGTPESEPTAIKCANCTQPMHGDADHYCKSCYEDDEDEHEEPDGDEDEEAKALAAAGLLGKTRKETRSSLARFAAAVLETTGSPSAAVALGKVAANATAAAELAAERATRIEAEAQGRKKVLGELLASAVTSKRRTLGEIAAVVPTLLGTSKADARAAVAGVKRQDISSIAAALASVPVTADALESVEAWIGASASAALPKPTPAIPTNDPKAIEAANQAQRTAGQIPDYSLADEARRMRGKENAR